MDDFFLLYPWKMFMKERVFKKKTNNQKKIILKKKKESHIQYFKNQVTTNQPKEHDLFDT